MCSLVDFIIDLRTLQEELEKLIAASQILSCFNNVLAQGRIYLTSGWTLYLCRNKNKKFRIISLF